MVYNLGPTFNDLTQVGFNSSDPDTWKSRKTSKDVKFITLDRDEMVLDKDEMTKGEDLKEFDDDDEYTLAARKLNDELIKRHAAKIGVTFFLGEPLYLAVRRKDGGFSKQAHIGGEDFIPSGSYVGKKGTLIFKFVSKDVANYVEMEIGEEQAYKSLSGLREYIHDITGGELERIKNEAIDIAALEVERKKMESNSKAYDDEFGFGSW